MSTPPNLERPASRMVTFYHDIEQNIDSTADPTVWRQMIKEFLNLEKKYGVPATYNVAGKLFQEQPDLIESILKEGQEVAFHSCHNIQPPEEHSNEIDLCRNVSPLPKGYRSPWTGWNQTTLKTLWERGFLWNAEADNHEEPYFIYAGLVRLPIAAHDLPLHAGTMNPHEWVQQFPRLLKSRRYFGFGSHDYVDSFAPEERLKAWERVLQMAVENKTLLVTFSEAADLFRRAAISKFYSTFAKSWNRVDKPLYRTNRFQQMIRAEAEKLNRPVVADLGSGGGTLSSQLRDIAETIYCVDNAPGMVKEVDSESRIEARVGEVTKSNLPDNSVDLVICARVIEYLFWPDHLADEIKRIGKMGATYFVTFPALSGTHPSHEGDPPPRIRHHFTRDEIQQWADQIGPGCLIGIQYETAEPDNPETEQRYRADEENPPKGTIPTNWVFIGTVQNKSIAKSFREPIPLSAFEFRLPSQRYDRLRVYLSHFRRLVPKPIHRLGVRLLCR